MLPDARKCSSDNSQCEARAGQFVHVRNSFQLELQLVAYADRLWLEIWKPARARTYTISVATFSHMG
eukprot:2348636-Pleurochrysis_carterae.AAC.3